MAGSEERHLHDPDRHAASLAHAAIMAGDATGWFEQLYADAAAGQTSVPWDRGRASELLVQWASRQGRDAPIGTADGARALVVGCGLGEDAEYIAQLGFAPTAFDIAPTAIATARSRFPVRRWTIRSRICSRRRICGPGHLTWSSRALPCRRCRIRRELRRSRAWAASSRRAGS